MTVNYKTGKFVCKISVESRFVNDFLLIWKFVICDLVMYFGPKIVAAMVQ